MKKLYEILSILMKYADKNTNYDVAAHHDTILIQGTKPQHLPSEDVAKLAALNCVFYDEEDCWKVYV